MGRDGYSMLEKVALLLDAFPDGCDLSLAQLVERTGLARSTVHRLLVEVIALGWVTRVGSRYELGTPLFEMGERVPVKRRLRALALPFMQDLFVVTGETVHLAVRDGIDALYVEKIHGHGALPLPSRIGGRAPLTCTAVGKALLAHDDPASVDTLLDRPMRRLGPGSITDAAVLRAELDGVRRTGLAVEREEAAAGGACAAAPVLVGGRPIAALSVSVPVERFVPDRLGPAVRTAAAGLARVLSAARPPDAPVSGGDHLRGP